jgi:hypothetical protein
MRVLMARAGRVATGASATLAAVSVALSAVAAEAGAALERGFELSAAAAVGHAMPADALAYGFGAGLKGTAGIGLLHAGAGLLFHAGDETSIEYGPVDALGIEGGKQEYASAPLFLLLDAGLRLELTIGDRTTMFAPFLSAGLLLVNMSTSGPYGEASTAGSRFAIGWGLLYRVPLLGPVSLGVEYRMYPIGDGEFEFGDSSANEVAHGFSTSLFFHALFLEASYRF